MTWENFQIILSGLPLSLFIAFASILAGFVLAVILTFCLSYYKKGIIYYGIKSYLVLFTGTPLLVQILLMNYGLGNLQWYKAYDFLKFLSDPLFYAVFALSLNSAAYTTQLFNGAMKAIPKNDYEACQALGLSKFQTIKLILSLALSRSMPSYSNELVLLFKSTSLVYVITLKDIMNQAQYVIGRTYDPISAYCMAGIIYLLVNLIIILCTKTAERYFLRFEKAG